VITSRDVVVIADSDIRVGREYLRALVADFESQAVGAVTCLYSGTPSDNFISRLGALAIDDGFAPSVLVALRLGELRFCLGATMAVRGTLLPVIGGLTALGNTFADDHELGQLVTRKGFRVQLSRYVVTTTVPETRFGELWAHELAGRARSSNWRGPATHSLFSSTRCRWRSSTSPFREIWMWA
jgi:ceramide glucosyltransferase